MSLIDNFTAEDSIAENALANTPYNMQSPSEAEATGSIPALEAAESKARLSVADVAVINGVGAGERRRFTLSEPANGYPRRVGNVQFTSPAPDPSEEGLYCNGGNIAQPKAIDTPLDDGDPELSQLGTDFARTASLPATSRQSAGPLQRRLQPLFDDRRHPRVHHRLQRAAQRYSAGNGIAKLRGAPRVFQPRTRIPLHLAARRARSLENPRGRSAGSSRERSGAHGHQPRRHELLAPRCSSGDARLPQSSLYGQR